MLARYFGLSFSGYWLESTAQCGAPPASGIYGVYAAMHDVISNMVWLNRLLYIGEAGNVQERIAGHEKWLMWRNELRPGEVLSFNAATIGPAGDRQRAEAAMIFEHKPTLNVEYKYYFPFQQTTVSTSGCNALMKASLTVYSSPAMRLGATLLTGGPRW